LKGDHVDQTVMHIVRVLLMLMMLLGCDHRLLLLRVLYIEVRCAILVHRRGVLNLLGLHDEAPARQGVGGGAVAQVGGQ
jgi:hypothetical protein